MANIGDIIEGRFQILEEINRGGMSVVYLAKETTLKSTWALKEVTRAGNESKYQKALQEAQLMSELKHSGIPIIVDIREDKERGVAYIAMQYIPGNSLQDIMLEQKAPFSEAFVTETGVRIAEIIEYLHQQTPPVIHRDIKPANIMYVENDKSLWLLDFGEAKRLTKNALRDDTPSGTKEFMPPEQRSETYGGRQISNEASDIFALGSTLFYMVTGQFSTRSPNTDEYYSISDIDANVSKMFSDVIAKAMAVSPEKRYATVAEFRNALMRCTADVIERSRVAKVKIRRFSAGLIAAAVCTLAGIGCLVVNRYKIDRDYDFWVRVARSSDGTQEEKLAAAMRAISIKPEKLDAYDALRELQDSDYEFTVEEESQFFGVIAPHKGELELQPEYSEFAYNIGQMYLMSYSHSSESYIKAIDWFSAVSPDSERYKAASVYREIGEYDRNIEKRVDAGTESGAFMEEWNNLQSAMQEAQTENNELLQLRLFQKVLSAITDYSYYLRKDGVERASVTATYDSICEFMGQIADLNGIEAKTTMKAIELYVKSLDEKPSITKRDQVFLDIYHLLSPAWEEIQKRYGKE